MQVFCYKRSFSRKIVDGNATGKKIQTNIDCFFSIIMLYSRLKNRIVLRHCSLGSYHLSLYHDINSIQVMLTVDSVSQDRSCSLNLPIIVFQKVGCESKNYGKDQESIQSSTTPDPGYHISM